MRVEFERMREGLIRLRANLGYNVFVNWKRLSSTFKNGDQTNFCVLLY
jgi:hypothetical protein